LEAASSREGWAAFHLSKRQLAGRTKSEDFMGCDYSNIGEAADVITDCPAHTSTCWPELAFSGNTRWLNALNEHFMGEIQ
jgi:hypothetical protein